MNWFWHAVWIFFVVMISVLWVACTFRVGYGRADLVWWKRLVYLQPASTYPPPGQA
jgi:hypothetical protein